MNGHPRRPSPLSELGPTPKRNAPYRRGDRVVGSWSIDVGHPDGTTSTATLKAIWPDKGVPGRLRAAIQESDVPLQLIGSAELCPCPCDLPVLVGLTVHSADAQHNVAATLVPDSRRLLGMLIFRIADQFDLLPHPEGEPKAG